MRISFDVDDTLVCSDPAVPTEQFVPWCLRPWFKEPLRRGTRTLLKELMDWGCEIWVYTTSHRGPLYLRLWFCAFGVRLGGVVNQDVHDRVVKPLGNFPSRVPSKYPPAFGIGLHVDDSAGVGLEGKQHGFEVVVVSPADPQWATRVLDAVERRLDV